MLPEEIDRCIAVLRHRREALAGRHPGEAAAIDAAIVRLQAGTYGICGRCGLPISEGRMQAQPSAELCLACQELQEQHRSLPPVTAA